MMSNTCKGCRYIKKYTETSDGNKTKYFCKNNGKYKFSVHGDSIHPFKILNLNDIICDGYKKNKKVKK